MSNIDDIAKSIIRERESDNFQYGIDVYITLRNMREDFDTFSVYERCIELSKK